MISWIVASHDSSILDANLRATLQLEGADELILIEDATSITVAYNQGQSKATQPVRCYVHHDLQILDSARLRANLIEHCKPAVGLVGVIGSRTPYLPWWEGRTCGSAIDSRMGLLDSGPGGYCAYLDGVLLATVHHIAWDESYPGWHMYDMDASHQMLTLGRPNWCLDNGHELVKHNATGTWNTRWLQHYHDNIARFHTKWPSVEQHRR